MRFGSLFTGIGALDKGLEDSGMKCSWQVESDDYALSVLAKHWPGLPKYHDVKTFPPEGTWGSSVLRGDWSLDIFKVDLICGGFPCQGLSAANYMGRGLGDERSGLWFEFARIIGLLRPRYVLVENVPALTFRGLGTVLGGLAALGYDAEWQTIPANAFGAPHRRERLFIVAYPASQRRQKDAILQGGPFETPSQKQMARIRDWPGRLEFSGALPDRVRWVPDASVCRVVDGAATELHRYRVCGNSVVRQVVQWIGKRIMGADAWRLT
jgi:DNA (cytosine-5)-methyltransferase 1